MSRVHAVHAWRPSVVRSRYHAHAFEMPDSMGLHPSRTTTHKALQSVAQSTKQEYTGVAKPHSYVPINTSDLHSDSKTTCQRYVKELS